MATGDFEIVAFRTIKEWDRWLAKRHITANGVWIRFFKKDSDVKSIRPLDALESALCHGWIDGQAKPCDAESWLQKFTPRRARSIWSKRNCEWVERLIKAGRMTPAGLQQIEAAKADGRWERAYDSPSQMTVPPDFLAALARNKKAKTFFESLNRANVYAIGWRLQTAKKPETRERRMKAILAMLAAGEKFH